ncbi:hypothetical protein NPIL_673141 [Nephila pilipes]|uniref:Uncharacterized protein n=1 Tax=Nephila pilipes TaxID=299642 RepID=A0A8X6PQ37_NEPPI|nr:hypothetical protein NPIL_673141 [Nephila pilipes]
MLHIYTDVSLLDFSQDAGVDVLSDSFSSYLHVGTFTTRFHAELEAIHVALQLLAVRLDTFERVVIFSDSVSAIQVLSSYQERIRVHIWRILLKEC